MNHRRARARLGPALLALACVCAAPPAEADPPGDAARLASAAPTASAAAAMPAPAAASLRPAPGPPIAFVPLDDRPVTYQLPIALGRIAGRPVLTPPRAAIGHYLQPGDPDAIARWLRSDATAGAAAVVASTDMLAYGGLVASRVPGVPTSLAYARLRDFTRLERERGVPLVYAFCTVMRLAPTGVPKLGLAADYYATGDTVDDLQAYANLPDPPRTDEQRAKAQRLRAEIGEVTLGTYLATRARNRDVDEWALQLAAEGGIDRLVIGQDDAGPTGLHLADLAALRRTARAFDLGDAAEIEPGADELGMVQLGRAFARGADWTPAIRVDYSRADGGAYEDRLEFAPIDVTIGRLIEAVGGRRVATGGDLALAVRVPLTSAADEAAFETRVAGEVAAHASVAVADLSFLEGQPGDAQQALTRALVDRGIAGDLDAFASWNTNANTVGTALAEAVAVGAGRRTGRYDARAHAEFMLDRYMDDYAFHQFVRPELNAVFRARGVDTTLLAGGDAGEASRRNRALLWPLGLDLLASVYPRYRDAGLTITLPWQRTFEAQIDVRLDPRDASAP